MAKKKAKWLEESTLSQLLVMAKEAITAETPDLGKVTKIVEELIERQPAEGENEITVTEAIAALEATMAEAVESIKSAYQSELDGMDDGEDNAAPVDTKKADKAVSEDKEDEGEADEGEADEYEDMSTKALKAECKKRGIKVTKAMRKEALVATLTADDKPADKKKK